MKQLCSRKLLGSGKLGKLIALGAAAFAVLLGAADRPAFAVLLGAADRPASAITRAGGQNADADTAVNAYLQALVRPNGTSAFIKGDQKGGDPGFWQKIEEIEGIEDANDRTGGAYNSQVAALLNGFIKAHGTLWSNNVYNDDMCWAAIAYTRGYEATGNTMFRTIAKNNFDMMFARLGPRQRHPLLDDQEYPLQFLHRMSRRHRLVSSEPGAARRQLPEQSPGPVRLGKDAPVQRRVGRGLGCGEHVRQSGHLGKHL